MKLQVHSQRSTLLSQLAELIHSQQERSSYSQLVEFSLGELVRQTMRSIAQQGQSLGERRLLEQAMQQAERQVQERVDMAVAFNFEPYRASLEPGLKYAAREIAALAGALQRSRQEERTGWREELSSAAGVPFELIEVGVAEAIEAVMTIPLVETVELDLDEVGALYEIEGEWFPFQLMAGEVRLTLQADGQLYTCIDRFPQSLRASVREQVIAVACQLYTQFFKEENSYR